MPPIRPYTPPVIPTVTPKAPQAADVRAAQRAFFQQAVGDTTPAGAPVMASAATATARTTAQAVEPAVTRVKTQPIPDQKPTRYMQPGSFIDIKV
jgi:hypothetical protein